LTEHRTIAELIIARRGENKSLRGMARRAAAMGTPITASALSAWATGRVRGWPSASTRKALANALDVSVGEIALAATATSELTSPDPAQLDRPDVHAWLALIEGRTEVEIEGALGVARATLRMWDAARNEPPP